MNSLEVAIHEAGHAIVLASLGHANDIMHVTATAGFLPPDLAAHLARVARYQDITESKWARDILRRAERTTGYVQRDPDSGPLPLAVEIPYCLAGAVAELRHAPEGAFRSLTTRNLNGDIMHLSRGLKRTGYEVSFGGVWREVNRLLFQRADAELQASSIAVGTRSLMCAALRGDAVSNTRHDCVEVGYALATEKIRTHWNVVRALADLLVEKDAVCSPDLLAFFERHGLSSA